MGRVPIVEAIPALQKWFATKLDTPCTSITNIERLSVGHSNDTFGMELKAGDSSERSRRLVLRTRPEGVGLLEPYDLARQYKIISAMQSTDVPVPRTLWLEEDEGVIGRPFFVMERVECAEAIEMMVPDEILNGGNSLRRRICLEFVRKMAAIHSVQWKELDLSFLGSGEDFLTHEVAWWESEMARVQRGPLPAIEALIKWLRANQPVQCPKRTLVHGDCKWGNFAFRHDQVVAVFDWEMTAIGDPLTDIGWNLMLWKMHPVAALPGSLAREEILEQYEELTGITVKNLLWYETLAALKVAVIELVGSMLFHNGDVDDLRYIGFATSIPYFVVPALHAIGYDEIPSMGDIDPSRERIAEGIESCVRKILLPELSSEYAQAQLLALRNLAFSGMGLDADVT
jgi:aminoglycoside phosphotransferase (APT) family kinase protein